VSAAASEGLRVTATMTDARGAMQALVRYLPMNLAVREIMRMRALAEYETLAMPMLDVGCGDGLFWEVLAKELIEGKAKGLEGLVGIDINPHELDLASVRLSPVGGDVRAVDISDPEADLGARFKTILANCSLEHVPALEPALRNIRDFMTPDGDLFLVVPAPRWTDTLAVKKGIGKLSARLAGMYAGLFDGFFQHHHLYPAWVWEQLLCGLGFDVTIRGIGAPHANRLAELSYPGAVFSFSFKAVFKRYPARVTAPIKTLWLRRLEPFLREIESGAVLQDDLESPHVVEWFIHARQHGSK